MRHTVSNNSAVYPLILVVIYTPYRKAFLFHFIYLNERMPSQHVAGISGDITSGQTTNLCQIGVTKCRAVRKTTADKLPDFYKSQSQCITSLIIPSQLMINNLD